MYMNKTLKTSVLVVTMGMISASVTASQLIVQQGNHACEFDLATGTAVSIDPVTGDMTAQVTNLEDCMGAPEPAINSFTRSPSSIESGQSVTFNWSTEHVQSCAATAASTLPGWSGGNFSAQGPQTVVVNAAAGNYSAGLICQNASGDTVTAGPLNVTVTTGNGTPECTDRPPPAGLTRANNGRMATGTGTPSKPAEFCSSCGRQWHTMFDHNFARGNEAWYYQESGRYHALEFQTGPLPAGEKGQIALNESNNFATFHGIKNGRRFMSISKCPGDFHKAKLEPGCFTASQGVHVFFWEGSANESVIRCPLEPNTTYYLNIVYTDSPENDPNPEWSCTGQQPGSSFRGCGNMMTPSGSNYQFP